MIQKKVVSKMSYKKLINELSQLDSLVIMGHLDPDADSVSSMLAIYYAFAGDKKNWHLLLQDTPGDNLSYLPGFDKIKQLDNFNEPIKNILLVDCKDLNRANRIGLQEENLDKLLVIDHHLSKAKKNPLKLIDSSAAACCELIYKLIKKAKIPLTQDLALILYSGLASDTGCFRQSNTTAQTLNIASKLLKTGFNPDPVRINLFERRSAANIKILGKALSNMEVYFDNKLCFLTAYYKDKQNFGASVNDCTSIVNYALTPIGAKIGVFFEERENDVVKISFRSRNGYAVNSFAEMLGGGGHLLAAGVTVNGKIDDVKKQVLELISEKYFKA